MSSDHQYKILELFFKQNSSFSYVPIGPPKTQALQERGVCLPPGRGWPGNGGPVSHPRTGTRRADGPLPAVQQAGRSQPWPQAVSPSACSAHRRAGGPQPSPASSSHTVLTQAHLAEPTVLLSGQASTGLALAAPTQPPTVFSRLDGA